MDFSQWKWTIISMFSLWRKEWMGSWEQFLKISILWVIEHWSIEELEKLLRCLDGGSMANSFSCLKEILKQSIFPMQTRLRKQHIHQIWKGKAEKSKCEAQLLPLILELSLLDRKKEKLKIPLLSNSKCSLSSKFQILSHKWTTIIQQQFPKLTHKEWTFLLVYFSHEILHCKLDSQREI